MTTNQYHVSANGNSLGYFEADDEQGAKDACARDAGYESEADMVARLGEPSELDVEEAPPVDLSKGVK